VEETKSSPTDVVTLADRAAEELLRDLLRSERPDDAVLGE
jgi:myo-inositol-1(or 4)-monophosphatase